MGAGTGELMPPVSSLPSKSNERFYLLDTLETPNVIGVEPRNIGQHSRSAGVLSAALDTAQTAQAGNAIEKMLCHRWPRSTLER